MSLKGPNSANRVVIVAIMLVSWLVISNHCALGMMRPTPETKAKHACCNKSGKEQNKDGPKAPVSCCKTLKVSLIGADAKVGELKAQGTVPYLLIETLFGDILPKPTVTAIEHGPPKRTVSFAEAVLQRSLLSHAPPALI